LAQQEAASQMRGPSIWAAYTVNVNSDGATGGLPTSSPRSATRLSWATGPDEFGLRARTVQGDVSFPRRRGHPSPAGQGGRGGRLKTARGVGARLAGGDDCVLVTHQAKGRGPRRAPDTAPFAVGCAGSRHHSTVKVVPGIGKETRMRHRNSNCMAFILVRAGHRGEARQTPAAAPTSAPRKTGPVHHDWIVDGKPWLALGGEVDNSASSSPGVLMSTRRGRRSVKANLNNGPGGPRVGLVDAAGKASTTSTLVDGLLDGARKHKTLAPHPAVVRQLEEPDLSSISRPEWDERPTSTGGSRRARLQERPSRWKCSRRWAKPA